MSGMNGKGYPYGLCEKCGADLMPVWFRKKEYKTVSGSMIPTGRTRRAVSHLTCSMGCIRDYPVDDTFDGPWEDDKRMDMDAVYRKEEIR